MVIFTGELKLDNTSSLGSCGWPTGFHQLHIRLYAFFPAVTLLRVPKLPLIFAKGSAWSSKHSPSQWADIHQEPSSITPL
jgi:hypothetical protein